MAERKRKRNWTSYIIVGLICAAVALWFMTRSKQDNATKVVVEAAQKRTIIETVSASGKVFPTVEVEMTSNVSGTIVQLMVAEGEFVKAGQLLARIDPDQLQSVVDRAEAATSSTKAQLESIKAQKAQLEAQFKNTKITYDRNKLLFEQGVISKAEMDASQASYETILANLSAADQNIRASEFTVKSSEATVKEQRKNLSQTSIYAPMDGIVSKLYKKRGEQVVGTIQMAGTPILKIANLNSVEVRIDVNERDILNVALGDSADIELDAYPNRKFLGIVTQIANTANNLSTLSLTSDQVTNFEVRVRLEASSYQDLQRPDGKSPFRAGLSASADIKTNTLRDVMTVPVASVTAREDTLHKKHHPQDAAKMLEYVFVQQGDSVMMFPVKVGAQDDTYIEITSGLKGGELVVKAPYEAIAKKLNTGSKIKAVSEEELYDKNTTYSAAPPAEED